MTRRLFHLAAAVSLALCVATTVIIRMGKARYAFVTLLPLVFITIVTMSAGFAKIFSPLPKLGFLAHAHLLESARLTGTLPPGVKSVTDLGRMIFNDYLDAAVAGFFLVLVVIVIADSARIWLGLLRSGAAGRSTEVPFEPGAMAAGD